MTESERNKQLRKLNYTLAPFVGESAQEHHRRLTKVVWNARKRTALAEAQVALNPVGYDYLMVNAEWLAALERHAERAMHRAARVARKVSKARMTDPCLRP